MCSQICSQFDPAPWNDRWDSLREVMITSIDWYRKQDFPRKSTLLCLMKRLQAFAQGQVDYLMGDGTDWDLFPEYPPEYALDTVLDQIGHDIEVIQRAAEQRISGSSAMQTALQVADYLAWQALSPALGGQGALIPDERSDPTTVLTYFHKSANIRVIPYAPLALVGIPFTCVPSTLPEPGQAADRADAVTVVAQDYLAIPHEVGHHVYWRSREVQTKILFRQYLDVFRQLDPRRLGYLRWLEEIFADVYGCLLAGPWAAESFQDIALTAMLGRFFRDDREHPIPAVRPYMYTQVLEAMDSGIWANELETCWETRRENREASWDEKQRGKCVLFPRKRLRLEEPLWPDDLIGVIGDILWVLYLSRATQLGVRKGIQPIVEQVRSTLVDELLPIKPNNWWQDAFPPQPAAPPQPGELVILPQEIGGDQYQVFEDEVRTLLANPPAFPGPELVCDELLLANLWQKWYDHLLPGVRLPKDPLNLEATRELVERIAENDIPEGEATWADVVHAEGWTTKGPNDGWHR
jgi:hypothetical protein